MDTGGYGDEYKAFGYNWPDDDPYNAATRFSNIPEEPANFLEIVKHTKFDLISHKENANAKAVSQLLDTTAWADFAKGKGAEFAIGGPTIEMWCASWNAVLDKKGGSETGFKKIEVDEENTALDTRGYCLKSANAKTEEFYYMGVSDTLSTAVLRAAISADYSTFWSHVGEEDIVANNTTGSVGGYWLASPDVNPVWPETDDGEGSVIVCGSAAATLHPAGDEWTNLGAAFGLRPLVSLLPGTQLVDSGKTTAKNDKIYTIQ